MQNKERNFSPSVFLRELSHACRKLHCLHCGITSEGLKSPTVRDLLLLDPQNRTVNQGGGPLTRKGLIHNVLGYLMFTHEEIEKEKKAGAWLGLGDVAYFEEYLHGRRQRRTYT